MPSHPDRLPTRGRRRTGVGRRVSQRRTTGETGKRSPRKRVGLGRRAR